MAFVFRKNGMAVSVRAGTLLSFGLFVYFAFHLLHGSMGYFALRGVEQRLSESRARAAKLEAERAELENHVRLLRSGSLDLDMLDERARAVLGFAAPEDRVVVER